jgi:hypothetical protein
MSYAVACIGNVGVCADRSLCAPPPPPGFYVCVSQGGDDTCPNSMYTEKHLAFTGFDNTRTCSPCTCSAPSGGKCTAEVSIYADNACTSTAYTETVDSTMAEWCYPVTAGPLLSKSAEPPVYEPGSCQPAGGVPIGSVTLTGPTTFCCMPTLSGPPTP